MTHNETFRVVMRIVGLVLLCCGLSRVGWADLYTNNKCTENTADTSGCQCPDPNSSGAGTGCAWVKITAGPMRPGSSISTALFRMGEDVLTASTYTPQALNFVAGYAMKGISHDITRDGAPRRVTLIHPGGVPFAFQFSDGASIGVPVADSGWALNLRLFMVDANGWAVLKEPAYYDLYTKEGDLYRFNAYKASPQYMQLILHRTVSGREETYQDLGVEVIRDASQNLRQVLLPSRLADIVVEDNDHFSVKYYGLSKLTGGKDTNGCYRLIAQAEPFETWTFGNPEPGTLRKLLVKQIIGARTKVYDFTYNSEGQTWAMTTGDGVNVMREETKETMWNDAMTERQVTRSVKDGSGGLVSRTTERIKALAVGDGVTLRVTDPGGANLTNRFTYNAAGLTETAVEPDGSWRYYGYDAAKRITKELAPVGDSVLTSAVSAAHGVVYDFTPVDPNDSPRLSDQQPRTVTESVLGAVVARTYRAYRTLANREYQEVMEKVVNPSAVYGDASSLRTVTTYYGTNTANCQIGRVKTVAYPDGRQDTFTYGYGTYQPAIGEIPPSFTPSPVGNYWCETVVHGTVNEPFGIADKTTKETRILDPMGEEVLSETWVCQGGPNYERVAWVAKTFDDWQHPILTLKSNGERTEASWGENCCGKEWEIGPDGVMYSYGYDSLARMITRVKRSATSNDTDLVTSFTYDAAGHRLTETLAGGGLSQLISSNTYDLAGRLVSTVDGQGIITTYSYAGPASTTIRGGLTNTTVRYLSGQWKATLKNGVIKTAYDYGVSTNGTQWSKAFTGPSGTNSPMWSKTTTDLLGRTVKEEKPGFPALSGVEGGDYLLATIYSYNTKGQLTSTTQQPNNSTTLNEYNELGEQIRSGLDVNTNGVLDLAGPDRVTESASWFEQDGAGNYWQCRALILYAGNNSATPTTNSVQKTRLTGFSQISNCASEMVAVDTLGNSTISRNYVNRANKAVTQTVIYPDSTNAATQVTINGQLTSSTSKTGVQTAYACDPLGRQTCVSSGGSRSVATVSHYNDNGQIDWTMDAASNRTSFIFDDLGRRVQVTDALSNSTFTTYDAEGRTLATWGATYPVAYDYDAYGRMTAMYTLRDSSLVISNYSSFLTHISSFDRTTWLYDQATGLLTNKLYSDNKGPAYTYTADGKLLTRIWARGVVTTYNYDSLGQLTNISYSDGTPCITFAYDRLGRQTTITDGTGTRTFTYNDALQLVSETNTQSILTYASDTLGRPAGFSSGRANPPDEPSYSVRYGYDLVGRFLQVDADLRAASLSPQNFHYGYLAGSDLIQSVQETNTGFNVVRSYEPNRNLIASITNGFGGVSLHRFDYANDEIGRRVKRADVDISTVISNLFAYNMRSELEDVAMGTNSFNYRYDPIGNRRTATNNAEAMSYAANSLNQYSAISNQQSQILPAYDADGNIVALRSLGEGGGGYKDWTFVWDAENRLVLASNANTVISNSYDYMSRRVSKTTQQLNSPATETRFLYQGWAMIAESTASSTNSYVYGLDLSGTAQGAGTIGGLLSLTTQQPSNSTTAFYCYDANGNVTDLFGTNGQFLAQYQFDPYGNTISKTGALADVNPFRFSTKYLDAETGLYYYGYRYYVPEIGRWASRDPIGEKFDINIIAFCINNPIDVCDHLGLVATIVLGPKHCSGCEQLVVSEDILSTHWEIWWYPIIPTRTPPGLPPPSPRSFSTVTSHIQITECVSIWAILLRTDFTINASNYHWFPAPLIAVEFDKMETTTYVWY